MLILAGTTESSFAVGPGKTLTWNTEVDNVVFDGRVHARQGLTCMDCHDEPFQTRKGAAMMKMSEINAGNFCGKCHNGTKGFDSRDPNNCSRCHKKKP